MEMNEKEKAAARWLQGDIPEGPRPYAVIGEAVGLTEERSWIFWIGCGPPA
jgi:DNA-binding Lrp family transcriptional regulator